MLTLTTNTLAVIVACIWQTEGGAHTSHPYGVMVRYNHTTAKQACENTVKHVYKDFYFDSPGLSVPTSIQRSTVGGEFINFLSDKYCPPSIDPRGNLNWRKNMILLMKQKGLVLK